MLFQACMAKFHQRRIYWSFSIQLQRMGTEYTYIRFVWKSSEIYDSFVRGTDWHLMLSLHLLFTDSLIIQDQQIEWNLRTGSDWFILNGFVDRINWFTEKVTNSKEHCSQIRHLYELSWTLRANPYSKLNLFLTQSYWMHFRKCISHINYFYDTFIGIQSPF